MNFSNLLKNKFFSLTICLLIYIFVFWISYNLLPTSINSIWIKITIWHLYATCFIYLFSVLFNNSSLYDPFWSVAPIPIVLYLSFNFSNSVEVLLLVLTPVLFWALRLTYNWALNWKGFHHEDFRYVDLKDTNLIKAQFNNFFGIHIIPTLIVNISLYPILFILSTEAVGNTYLYIASIFTLSAIILETIADNQMRFFRSNEDNKRKTMRYKLWKYSRHPNYLGELMFWFGIYFMGISSLTAPTILIICPLIMLFLFVFISCPMMDKRSLKNRDDYEDYMRNTSQLFLYPPKS